MKIGFPDNPNCKTKGMFKDNYLVSLNKDILDTVKEYNFDLVELHFQLMEEIAIDGGEFDKTKEYVNKLREKGISIMMHSPFLTKNLDFVWPVKPKSCENAREFSDDELKEIMLLCDKLEIERLTLHVSKPLTFLDNGEFGLLESRLDWIIRFIKKNNLNVKLAIETGGLTKWQLLKLMENPDLYITFDLTHYILDTNESIEEAIEFFVKIKNNVYQIHLSQTESGKDMHKSLHEEGIIDNAHFIRYLGDLEHTLGREFLVLLEMGASKEDINFIKEILSLQ